MDWTEFTINILEFLKNIGGSYGMAIILLTIIVRVALIPLSVSQQKSMKKMQELSPKLKLIQTRYKNDPPVMQQKMMEFYKENKFNPMGGCLPLLLQMPVFILLYTTLISVAFLQVAGNSSFLFIHRLDATMQTHASVNGDGKFAVVNSDRFVPESSNIKFKLKSGEAIGSIPDYRNAIHFAPSPLKPGEPVTMLIMMDKINFNDQQVNKQDIISASIPVIDDTTKELETLEFKINPKKTGIYTVVNTSQGANKFNFDVFVLLLLFAGSMYFSQKVMTSMSSTAEMDPQQKAMQQTMGKMMPIMILAMFVIIPIPAGVLLYMVVSNMFQIGQTWAINKYLENENVKIAKPSDLVVDVHHQTVNNQTVEKTAQKVLHKPDSNSRKIKKGRRNK